MGTQLIEHAGPTGLWSAMALACLLLSALQPALVRHASHHDDDGGQLQSAPVELQDKQASQS
jgi:hypothetical protein